MNRDIEIMLEVDGRLGYMASSTAIAIVADKLDMTKSGVRGMRSRALATRTGQLALMEWRSTHVPRMGASASKIASVVNMSNDVLNNAKAAHSSGYAVWIGDPHFPKQDTAAMSIVYDMVADLPDVLYWSALNDALDFGKLSFWDDRRWLRKQAIEDDIADTLKIHNLHLDIMREVAPGSIPVAIVGNHDLRIATVNATNGLGVYDSARLMVDLYAKGVVFPGPIYRQNAWRVNKSLVWAHGWSAAQTQSTAARKNYEQAKRELGDRYDFDMIFGHSHRFYTQRLGLIQVHNAGHLANPQADYAKSLLDWQQGLAISRIDGDDNTTATIPITRKGNRLQAFNPFNGKTYEAQVNAFSTID